MKKCLKKFLENRGLEEYVHVLYLMCKAYIKSPEYTILSEAEKHQIIDSYDELKLFLNELLKAQGAVIYSDFDARKTEVT